MKKSTHSHAQQQGIKAVKAHADIFVGVPQRVYERKRTNHPS